MRKRKKDAIVAINPYIYANKIYPLMKKILFLLFAFVLMASCTATLPKQIVQLADKAEKKGASFSQEQWSKVTDQFNKLVEEYNKNIEKFNADQKKEVNAAIGKFQAASLKAGLGQIGDAIEEVVEGAKSFLEGLGSDEEPKE